MLARELWALAWPAIIREIALCGAERLALVYFGQFVKGEVAKYDAIGVGRMYGNVVGRSLGLGMCLGLATLCAQAFGAGRAAIENGLHLRRCCVVLLGVFVITASLGAVSEQALLAVGQPPAVARYSAQFVYVVTAAMPFGFLADALVTVTDSIEQPGIGMYSKMAGALSGAAFSLIAIHPSCLDWGHLGAAAGSMVSWLTQVMHASDLPCISPVHLP